MTKPSTIFAANLLLFTVFSLSAWADGTCEKVRAAYDVGTSGIKLSAKVIDVCRQNAIVKDLYSDGTIPVGFGAQLKDATLESPKPFGKAWLAKEGIQAFIDAKNLVTKEVAKVVNEATQAPYTIDEHVGIATHAFRVSTDGKKFLENEVKALGIDIRRISQAREGELEFAGVQRSLKNPVHPSQIASWGIGDGSQQFMAMQGEEGSTNVRPLSYLSSIASGTFKEKVIKKLNRQSNSPNPISNVEDDVTAESDYSVISKLADDLIDEAIAKQEAQPFLNWMIKTHPKVYGVGGIHTGAIQGALKLAGTLQKDDEGNKFYDVACLAKALKGLFNLTDVEIVEKMNPDRFKNQTEEAMAAARADTTLLTRATTQVSSMILVLRTMKKFDVKQVYLSKANSTGEIYFMKEFAQKPANVVVPSAATVEAPRVNAAKKAPAQTKPLAEGKYGAAINACMNYVKNHLKYFISVDKNAKTTYEENVRGSFVCNVGQSVRSCGELGYDRQKKPLFEISDDKSRCYAFVDLPKKSGSRVTPTMMVYVPVKN